MSSPSDRVQAAHREAVAQGRTHYRDPDTGALVFTSLGLEARGQCCGCGCRHCPYAHEAVPEPARAARIQRPAMLVGAPPEGPGWAVVFYSGGKDGYLALRAAHAAGRRVVLLTTFDAGSRIIAHQEVPVARVVAQARALRVPLLGVPLRRGGDYLGTLSDGLARLAERAELHELVFGDLHLSEIRAWREAQIGPLAAAHGATLSFPLWGQPYDALAAVLADAGVRVRVSAAPDEARIAPLAVGDPWSADAAEALPADVDRFGENGEFHTEVVAESLTPLGV
jgi:diphthamide synthase (EF-2-diphthine--ammonia ligase)